MMSHSLVTDETVDSRLGKDTAISTNIINFLFFPILTSVDAEFKLGMMGTV